MGFDASAVLESTYAEEAISTAPEPDSAAWRNAPRVVAPHDYVGRPIPGSPTEIRSRWTSDSLYLLYICPYDELHLKPAPTTSRETPRLWDWDVAEAFIGSDPEHITRYKEFQVSPQGEWLDLAIDRRRPAGDEAMEWDSGFTAAARIDDGGGVWYGLMRIPFRAVDARPPAAGRSLRLGLFRIAGRPPARRYYAWRPTGRPTFHVPEAFGTLRLR